MSPNDSASMLLTYSVPSKSICCLLPNGHNVIGIVTYGCEQGEEVENTVIANVAVGVCTGGTKERVSLTLQFEEELVE